MIVSSLTNDLSALFIRLASHLVALHLKLLQFFHLIVHLLLRSSSECYVPRVLTLEENVTKMTSSDENIDAVKFVVFDFCFHGYSTLL